MDRRAFLGGATGTVALGLARGAGAAVEAGVKLKVLVPGMPPDEMAQLKAAAPNVELVVCGSGEEAIAKAADADGSYGFVGGELIRVAKKLRWVQVASAGVEGVVTIPELQRSSIVLTNMQRIYAPEISDQALDRKS